MQVLTTVLKAALDPAAAYAREGAALQHQLQSALKQAGAADTAQPLMDIVWTKTLQRMYFLAKRYVFRRHDCVQPVHVSTLQRLRLGHEAAAT
jgi:hypothetical protein